MALLDMHGDRRCADRAGRAGRGRPRARFGRFELPRPSARNGPPGYAQIIRADGRSLVLGRAGELPVQARDRAVAAGRRDRFFSERTIEGEPVRVLTVPRGGERSAIAIGRSLADTEDALDNMRLVLIIIVLVSVAAVAAAGRLLTRTVMAPIAHLTDAAEHIEATGRLDRRVELQGSDEVARLAQRFNAMLERVEASADAQRRLVGDASHELRTPIASLRVDAEVLNEAADLPERHRAALAGIVGHTEELSTLVADLLELAHGDEQSAAGAREDLDLQDVAGDCVERARRHHPAVRFDCDLNCCPVHGDAARIARAVANLLDNAARYGGERGPVEVAVDAYGLTIRTAPGCPPRSASASSSASTAARRSASRRAAASAWRSPPRSPTPTG